MPTLVAIKNGNWTIPGTFQSGDTTSLNISEGANTALTTSYVTSSTFTPGALTVDGIAWHLASRTAGTASNVLFTALDQGGTTISGSEVYVNVGDLPSCSTSAANNEGGWFFTKFASGIPLVGATAYGVKAKLSATTTAVNLYSLATTNWSRILRTTNQVSPGLQDDLHIMGYFSGSGLPINKTEVCMDNMSTTNYGSIPSAVNSLISPGVAISAGGKLFCATTGTNVDYYLRLANGITTYANGTLAFTGIPSGSTATLEISGANNVDYGLTIRSNSMSLFSGQEKLNFWSPLSGNANATNITGINVDSTANWNTGDWLVFPSTTSFSQFETRGISGFTSNNGVNLTGSLSFGHSGIEPSRAIILNLTRNIKFRGILPTQGTFIDAKINAICDWRSIEFSNMGSSTANKRGIDLATTTASTSGSFNGIGCSAYNFVTATPFPLSVQNTNSTINLLSNFIIYNCPSVGLSAASLHNSNISNLFICGPGNVGANITPVTNTKLNISGLYIFNAGNRGIQILGANTDQKNCQFNNFVFIANGLQNDITTNNAIFNNIKTYKNQNAGINIFGNNNIINNFMGFDQIGTQGSIGVMGSDNYFNSGLIFSTNGVGSWGGIYSNSANGLVSATFENCALGTSGTHNGGDINLTTPVYIQLKLINCILASPIQILNQNNLLGNSFISSHNENNITGVYKVWAQGGILSGDNVIFNTSKPSFRMTPNGNDILKSAYPGLGGYFSIPVNSGSTVTPSVLIRTSDNSNGTVYTGIRPQLWVLRNISLGITGDTYLTQCTNNASGAWEQISMNVSGAMGGNAGSDGVVQCFIMCSGSAGFCNIDDWNAT